MLKPLSHRARKALQDFIEDRIEIERLGEVWKEEGLAPVKAHPGDEPAWKAGWARAIQHANARLPPR